MTRELWVQLGPNLQPDEKLALLSALNKAHEKAVVQPDDVELAKKLGVVSVSNSETSDIRLVEEAVHDRFREANGPRPVACHVVVKSAQDERRAQTLAERGFEYLVVTCPDWKIIPIENLIATVRGKLKLVAKVDGSGDARLLLETLELGVDGIIAECKTRDEIQSYRALIERTAPEIPLQTARITSVKQLGSGLRACVDTAEIMSSGEGILVGSKSSALFLIEAEVHNNPHVAPRPFRVNAGAVSLYVLAERTKTRYLSEIRAGDEVLVVNRNGKSRTAHVGRSKLERRPLVLVEAQTENGHTCVTLLQNAETIRLVTPAASTPVTELKQGDEVLVHIQEGGRHFGTLVKEETVIEQ